MTRQELTDEQKKKRKELGERLIKAIEESGLESKNVYDLMLTKKT